jgi:hypothetical protein
MLKLRKVSHPHVFHVPHTAGFSAFVSYEVDCHPSDEGWFFIVAKIIFVN